MEGNIAWVLVSTAMVLFMTPGLAFFYGGMVRSKNFLAMLMQNYFAMGLLAVLWVATALFVLVEVATKRSAVIADLQRELAKRLPAAIPPRSAAWPPASIFRRQATRTSPCCSGRC